MTPWEQIFRGDCRGCGRRVFDTSEAGDVEACPIEAKIAGLVGKDIYVCLECNNDSGQYAQAIMRAQEEGIWGPARIAVKLEFIATGKLPDDEDLNALATKIVEWMEEYADKTVEVDDEDYAVEEWGLIQAAVVSE